MQPDTYKERGRGMSQQQAADYVGCSLRKIEYATASGELTAYRLGRRVVVFQRDLDDFLDSLEPVAGGAR
jgi:excisionase family DNA binding protein